MPNLRNKNWTSETPAFKEDAQFWEDHLYDGQADQNIAKEVERATAAENKLESEKADKTTATSSEDGLMSKSDKAKLDGIGAGSNVKSVNGKIGAVTLAKGDVGLSNVDNTKDADKPVSTAVQTALDKKADSSDLASHTANKNNPHGVSKDQIGLGSVVNIDQSKAIKSIEQKGMDFTVTALDGSTSIFTQQDKNMAYSIGINPATGHMAIFFNGD